MNNEIGFADLLMYFLIWQLSSCVTQADLIHSCKNSGEFQTAILYKDLEKIKCEVQHDRPKD